MDELVAWYRQQLDEDEEAAKAATPGPWKIEERTEMGSFCVFGAHPLLPSRTEHVASTELNGEKWRENRDHIARHGPAAVLADIAAKRKLLDEYESVARFYATNKGPMTPDVETRGLRTAITLTARAYRHRPGWKKEWEA